MIVCQYRVFSNLEDFDGKDSKAKVVICGSNDVDEGQIFCKIHVAQMKEVIH
ncbi:MAG TPA: hypothetical protein VGS11_10945 [Candidatus Bathyarchaeia archaeon]|nr:hypothetical protein [Candidatus Bathyarchaeia archaeon]